jgi:hypothetical protein
VHEGEGCDVVVELGVCVGLVPGECNVEIRFLFVFRAVFSENFGATPAPHRSVLIDSDKMIVEM